MPSNAGLARPRRHQIRNGSQSGHPDQSGTLKSRTSQSVWVDRCIQRMSYYFEMGPIVHTNMDGFNLDSMGITGRPIPCVKSGNSPYMFYSLDTAAGAAAVAKLKEPGS
jgi:hypothetical protein